MTHTEQFTIRKRWSWLVDVTVTIECDPLATMGVKMGLAVGVARNTDAVLTGADLTGADLRGAVLRGEKITRLFASANRLDGYTFNGFEMEAGGVKINAGCRWFTPAQFRAHVAASYPDTDKARETLRLIDFIEGRAADLGIEVAA